MIIKAIIIFEVILISLLSLLYIFSIPHLGYVDFNRFNGIELVRLFIHISGGVLVLTLLIKTIKLKFLNILDEDRESQN